MMEHNISFLVVMAVYLAVIIGWGVYQGSKVKSGKDYSIAGRSLPGWIAALSERAAGESSWALLGLPGAAYATGLLEIWTALGCVAGIITAWSLLAWRLRKEADNYDVSTFVDYLAKKHPDASSYIRVIGSLTIVFFFFFYVGAQFLGGGKIFDTLFGINKSTGMLIMLLVVVPYTMYGGFRSVAYTDVIQALIMIVTLVIGPIFGLIYLSNHQAHLFAGTISLALNRAGESYHSLIGSMDGFAAGLAIASSFSWFFGYLGGQPQLSMRFMAIKNFSQAKKARNVGIAWTLLAYLGALTLGWIGIAMFGPDGLKDQETVMPMVIKTIFPPVIAAILITGALAAIVSTANSLLIVSSTELNENLLKSKHTDSFWNSLNGSRLITALLAILALVLTFILPSDLVFTIVGYVWAGVGCTFSVVILFSLFWKKFNGKAAVVSIVSGLLFTIFWISSGLDEKILTARIMTFAVVLVIATISTYIFQPGKSR